MANTNDSTEPKSQGKASEAKRPRFDALGVHPNSLANSLKNDPELWQAYKEWLKEIREDNTQMESWAKDGFISWGEAAIEYDVYEGDA